MSEYQFIAISQDVDAYNKENEIMHVSNDVSTVEGSRNSFYVVETAAGSLEKKACASIIDSAADMEEHCTSVEKATVLISEKEKGFFLDASDTEIPCQYEVSIATGGDDQLCSSDSELNQNKMGNEAIEYDRTDESFKNNAQSDITDSCDTNNSNVSHFLPPDQTKLTVAAGENKNLQLNSRIGKRKIRNSLVVGYSPDASTVLNEFELLKDEMNVESNIEMLQKMIFITRNYMNIPDSSSKTHAELTDPENSVEQDDSNEVIKIAQGLEESSQFPDQEEDLGSDWNMVVQSTQHDVTNALSLAALNIKTIQLAKKYFEHLRKDGLYLCGFIENSEKLDIFLKCFRLHTGSSFSIRRSKAKVNDDPDPEEKPHRKYKPGYLGKGQIKWEKNIGVPQIPFTGVPFTTEGSTTYQCVFGPKRVKSAARWNNVTDTTDGIETHKIDDIGSKRRRGMRESKKRDCPAQIHIRTVHQFPSYSCIIPENDNVSSSSLSYVNKCQRGIILARLREDISSGKVQGQQGYWARVPLPEVHQNHSLGPFDASDAPLNEDTIQEMKNVLQHAAISS